MKRIVTFITKVFKPVAIVKYLCFPFLIVQSHGVQQFSKAGPNGQIISIPLTGTNTLFTPAKPLTESDKGTE